MLPRGEYLTVQQVADHFNTSVRTVYRMVEDGTLEAVPLRKGSRTSYRIIRTSVVALQDERVTACS